MNEISLYSKFLKKEVTFKCYELNGVTILSAPALRQFFDTDPAFKDYRAMSTLDYCDVNTTIYHCDIIDKNEKVVVRGVGDTHFDTLPTKMHDCRSKLAETRAFSDAITRFLELPFQAYTDAQMLEVHTNIPKPMLKDTPKPQTKAPVETPTETTKAEVVEPTQEVTEPTLEVATTETTVSPYEFEEIAKDGSVITGVVHEDTLIKFGAFKDKTIGYIRENTDKREVYDFLNMINQKPINEASKKRPTVVAKYLVKEIDFKAIPVPAEETSTVETTAVTETSDPVTMTSVNNEDNSLLKYRYEENGEEGFVTEDTLVGFGGYKDKTIGYMLKHKDDTDIQLFLNALVRRPMNPVSTKKTTVVARYLAEHVA